MVHAVTRCSWYACVHLHGSIHGVVLLRSGLVHSLVPFRVGLEIWLHLRRVEETLFVGFHLVSEVRGRVRVGVGVGLELGQG